MRILMAALAALSFGSMASEAAIYNCVIPSSELGNWVPPQIVIAHDEKANRVVVSDPVILHFLGKPLDVEIDRNNAKRLTVKWTLKDVQDAADTRVLNFEYRATVVKSTKRVVVTAKPLGFGNRFEGRGRCAVAEG